ncbi:acyltransferase [Leptospira langatensis]|uniref:Acyltransferase n=1 Tax=Leptospira langatensis TaxID=2484983 RepID=A0A5F1ZU36_9LEPT|nr:acyltransferase [Leptospira langatensis]TGJ98989.1 acyltransferase [Leptospira langatensis]TGL40443.1 acyltransferase [Leptospira langatensis]
MKFLFAKQDQEVSALNGLRAFSIFLVIFYHFWHNVNQNHLLRLDEELVSNLLYNLRSGVDLFFILSGYLIYGGILKEKEQNGSFDVKRFYLKRTLRIMPAYYFCLFITYLYAKSMLGYYNQFPSLNETQLAAKEVALNNLAYSWTDIFYISNYFDYRLFQFGWSLSIEEQFYLVIPSLCLLLLFKVREETRRILILILFFLPMIVRALYYLIEMPTESVYIQTETRFDTIVVGMLIAEFVSWKPSFFQERRLSVRFSLSLISLVFLSLAFLTDRKGLGVIFNFTYFHLGYSAAFLLALTQGSIWNKFLGLSIFRPFARISYTMYLWHIPCTAMALKIFLGTKPPEQLEWPIFIAAGFFAILVSFLICIPIFYLTERPFLALRDFILKKAEKSPLPRLDHSLELH